MVIGSVCFVEFFFALTCRTSKQLSYLTNHKCLKQILGKKSRADDKLFRIMGGGGGLESNINFQGTMLC